MSAAPFDVEPVTTQSLFSASDLLHDVLASLNSSELAQRRFREIARVAGLVSTGYPGQPKSARQLQASSALFFEVFRKYDAGNLLLSQAEEEVLSQELEIGRLAGTLERMRAKRVVFAPLRHPSPMSLPLMVERFRERLSTETLADRLARMVQALEQAADATTGTHLAQHAAPSTDMAWDLPDSSGPRTSRARQAAAGDAPRRARGRHGF